MTTKTNSKMKIVCPEDHAIFIVEDEEHKNHLQRGNNENDPKIVGLYSVIANTPLGVIQSYVLAENEEAAISQATCKTDKLGVDVIGKDKKVISSYKAYRIPLMMRGWGAREF